MHACSAISVQLRLLNISMAVCCWIMAGFQIWYKTFNNEGDDNLKEWSCANYGNDENKINFSAKLLIYLRILECKIL